MPSKRRAEDDDDWGAEHPGEMAMGSITDLRHAEPKGRPFVKRYGPLGFDITPGQTKPKPKRKK